MKPKVEGVCDECGGELFQRKDDTKESLLVRLDHYYHETKPLEAFYAQKGLLHEIDGGTGIQKSLKAAQKIIDGAAK